VQHELHQELSRILVRLHCCDDWVVAAGVIVTLVIAGTLAHANLQTIAGGAISVGVLLVLVVSLWRATLSMDTHRARSALR
jgi:hypothetical protein